MKAQTTFGNKMLEECFYIIDCRYFGVLIVLHTIKSCYEFLCYGHSCLSYLVCGLSTNRSFGSTCSISAISYNTGIGGCTSLLAYIFTVRYVLPSFSASHVCLMPFEAKTSFILLYCIISEI